MRGLFKSSLLVIGVRVAGIVLQSVIVILLARYLPTEQMGIFALCYAILGLARMLGPLGLDQTTMRLIARARESAGLQEADHRILNGSFIAILVANTAVAMALVVSGRMTGAFGSTVHDAGMALLATAAALPAFAVIGLLTLQLRGFGQQVWAQIPDSILLQLVHGALLLGLWQTGWLGLASSLFAFAIAAWVIAGLYVLSRTRVETRWIMPDRLAYATLWSGGRDVWLALVVTALSVRAPLFVVAGMLGPAAAAIMDIATRFGTLPSITTSSVMATFSPRFAALHGSANRRDLSRALSLSSLIAVTPALGFLLVLMAGAPFAIGLLLPPIYSDALVPMLIICLAQLVNAWLGPATNLLLMLGQGWVVRNYSTVQLALVIILSFPAAMYSGLVGVTLVILLSQLVRDLGATLWSVRRLGLSLPPMGLWVRLGA